MNEIAKTEKPMDTQGIIFDHERRIGSLEKEVPLLSTKVESMLSSVEELKTIVVEGNRESMEFFKTIINHDQSMEKVKVDFKQTIQRMELEMKQKQIDDEEKLRYEQEKWAREQKTENRKMARETTKKIFLYGAPIITTLVTVINQLIENYIK